MHGYVDKDQSHYASHNFEKKNQHDLKNKFMKPNTSSLTAVLLERKFYNVHYIYCNRNILGFILLFVILSV